MAMPTGLEAHVVEANLLHVGSHSEGIIGHYLRTSSCIVRRDCEFAQPKATSCNPVKSWRCSRHLLGCWSNSGPQNPISPALPEELRMTPEDLQLLDGSLEQPDTRLYRAASDWHWVPTSL